ncbi:hypothetical protein SAMN05216349_13026 [Oribacterium sp. KHPX15]|uniref:hypothetical protein n=1 Tax=Oribacterium sp. KHPX15 TaxID=1855342 RepID=UPI0008973391|nr:hypothetical protein [Oribacterium sp. KHPX15]SEA80686.1 hypothetical protein SAMN05216349_13026 [Oribacterium sp. KHPX15]
MITKTNDPSAGVIYSLKIVLQEMNQKNTTELAKDIEELNVLLVKSGVHLTLNSAGESANVVLSYVNNIAKRNAGRKKMIGQAKTVSDVFNYRKSHTSEEAAAYAGIGIRSYQRRVKKYKELNRWHEDNPLYF